MGIDVYMTWKGQTEEDEDAQITGFRDSGATGYLRESYFRSEHYATRTLVPEAFNDANGHDWQGVPIPARVLADRAEAAVAAAFARYTDEDDRQRAVQNIVDFIELAKLKEAVTGEPVLVKASW